MTEERGKALFCRHRLFWYLSFCASFGRELGKVKRNGALDEGGGRLVQIISDLLGRLSVCSLCLVCLRLNQEF